MLETLDRDALREIADSLNRLPGPHFWIYGAYDYFSCAACHITFEYNVDPVPQGTCEPLCLSA